MNSSNRFAHQNVDIRTDLRCGDLGRIISLHGEVYDPIGDFGLAFEAYVAQTVAEYFLGNRADGKVWLAEKDDRLVGCAAIARRGAGTGQLRWVVVGQDLRGTGLGRHLVETALAHCGDAGLKEVYLETTLGLPASMSLYEKLGFQVVSEEAVELWNGMGTIITMRLDLS